MKTARTTTLRTLLLMGCASLFWTAVARAETAAAPQPDQGNGVAEVVVNARARTERLIDVPVAATVVTSEAVSRYSMTQISDIAKAVPQLEVNLAGAGTGANVSMRGVGSSSIDAGVAQPVSIVIDGVGASSGRLIFAGLFDVQAVEALEGPQALFFGKNSPAGVLSLTTTDPGKTFGGYLKGSYDFNEHQRFIEGAVTLPVNDTLSIRLAGRVSATDGYLINTAVAEPDPLTLAPDGSSVMTRPAPLHQGAGYSEIGRISVKWTPTDKFDVTAKFTAGSDHTTGAAGQTVILACAPGASLPALTFGPTFTLPDPTGTCNPGRYQVSDSNLPLTNMLPLNASGLAFDEYKTYIASLKMNYRMGNIALTSITGYINLHYANAGDYEYGSYAVLWGALVDDLSNFTQEFRASSSFAGPLNFTGGVLYEHSDRTFYQDVKVPGFTAYMGRYDNAFSVDPTTGDTYSAYLQLRWNILKNLELAGGARYTDEIKNGSLQNIYVRPGQLTYLPQGDVINAHVANDNVSPEVTLTWHPAPNATIYGAYKTGFLSGGISNPGDISANATAASLVFRPVSVSGGEIGAKGSFLGNTLSLSSVAYLYDYTDLQVISFNPITFSYTTLNAASARVEGAELQATWRATPALTLRGALSYNHGRYVEFPSGQCFAGQTAATGCVGGVQNLAGTPIGASPDWSGNIGLTYDRTLSGDIHGALSIDGYYRDAYNYTAANTYRPGAVQGAQMRLDASLRFYQPHKGLEFAVLVRNLTNELTILSGSDTPAGVPGQLGGYLAPPRQVVVEITDRF